MMFLDLRCFVCLTVFACVVFANQASATSTISFNITENTNTGKLQCSIRNTKKNKFHLNENLTVHVTTPKYLDDAFCTINGKGMLHRNIFKNKEKNYNIETQITTTYLNKGLWNCTFIIKITDSNNQKRTNCLIDVDIVSAKTSETPMVGRDELYIIIGGVVGGGVIILIIIIQAIIIIRYRRKLKNEAPKRLNTLSRTKDDPNRYSATPGEKKKKKAKREESGIYQSLENLRNAGMVPAPKSPANFKRPPMPLPPDDDEHIYDDGDTLTRMFAPDPPPTDTLPKHHIKKEKLAAMFAANSRPKPAPAPKPKPAPMPEDYDYPDTTELIKSEGSLSRPSKKNSLPLPAKAGKKDSPPVSRHKKPSPGAPGTALGAPGPMMCELENHLKRIKKNAPQRQAEPSSPSAPIVNVQGKTKMAPGFKPKPQLQTKPQPPKPQAPKELKAGPWSPDREAGLRTQEPQKNFMPPRIAPSPGAKSPPVSRVQPMAKVAPIIKSPPIPLKPVGPYKPPVTEETYEEVSNTPGSSDEEEWTYEPLPQYNIYNV